MRRWLLWFLLAPHSFLLAGLWRDAGLPPVDASVACCVYLAFFAERAAVPWLLLACAAGRAVVDEAALPVQILVLGVPVAAMLPLRLLFYRQHVWWQVATAALFAVAVPKLAGLCGQLFDQPSASSGLDAERVLWTALLGPALLALLRRLPPLSPFAERAP